MDLSSPSPNTNSPLTPVFGDNVQDLFNAGAKQVHPSATIVVNSIDDAVQSISGVTTLRNAINQANADDGEDLIVFDRSLFATAQTITLNLGELDITHSLDIIAPRDTLTGGDLVTVSGNNASRVFETELGSIVNISGLVIADGSVTGDNGGGIKNSGTLTLDSSIVRGDSAIPVGTARVFGGGIYNSGVVTVSNSTISGNSAKSNNISNYSAGYGGGIYNSSGTVTVSNSTISGNSADSSFFSTFGGGGGIYNSSGTMMVGNSTISGNSAANGGGIFSTLGSTVNLSNSTLNGNSASYIGYKSYSYGGGISNDGNLTVSNSTISGNSVRGNFVSTGGGIYNSKSGTMTVSNSTIRDNSASNNAAGVGGGGISNGGNLTVSNSTISGNSTSGNAISNIGGGIENSGTLTISNSTISGNSISGKSIGDYLRSDPNNPQLKGTGGGIYNSGNLTLLFSTLTLNQAANGGGVYDFKYPRNSAVVRHTIIASNLNSTDGVNPDVSGPFTSNGYNLIGDSTGSTGFDEAIGDIVGIGDNPIDPRLAPLDFNGGPTQTIALLQDSPAIDVGDPTILDTDPITDQRGLPRVSNGRTDIGAFEVQV